MNTVRTLALLAWISYVTIMIITQLITDFSLVTFATSIFAWIVLTAVPCVIWGGDR